MSTSAQVGLFVDFDAVRCAAIEATGKEPDCQWLMEKALAYGPVAMAYAYGDFACHPSSNARRLEIAGITARDVPSRQRDADRRACASMAMLLDLTDCLLDSPSVETLVLMTCDPAFVRFITRARHRFGKRVVISGPGRDMPADLIEAADVFDPLPDSASGSRQGAAIADDPSATQDEVRLLQLIDWLASNRPYMTFSFIRSHATSPHHGLEMADARVTELLSRFKEQGILIEGTRFTPDGRALRTLQLNERHGALALARRRDAPLFEAPASSLARAEALDGSDLEAWNGSDHPPLDDEARVGQIPSEPLLAPDEDERQTAVWS